jgi:hypothetical protein
MQAGNLVMITRASVGIAAGTIGFVLREHESQIDGKTTIYEVDIVGEDRRPRSYLARDLEVIK